MRSLWPVVQPDLPPLDLAPFMEAHGSGQQVLGPSLRVVCPSAALKTVPS